MADVSGTYIGAMPYYYTTEETTVFTFDRAGVIELGYLPESGSVAETVTVEPAWYIDAEPPVGLGLVTNGAAFTLAGQVYAAASGSVLRGWDSPSGAGTSVGSVGTGGLISLTVAPASGPNSIVWSNLAWDAQGGLSVLGGVFRIPVAPLSSGNFQLQADDLVGVANAGDIISGDFSGVVDATRGIVYWEVDGLGEDDADGIAVRADELTYNAVYLQYVPIDETLLGISTDRLPSDGKVPIYRVGGQVLVHNTLSTTLVNPVVKGTAYSLGRERIAAVDVRTVAGVKVPSSLYTMAFDAGEITFPLASDLTGYDQPFSVANRIEDELVVQQADISGALDLVGALTHNYPAGTSYVSSKLRKGDLFARTYLSIEQTTWTGVWSDSRIGDATTANFNDIDYPFVVTNKGAITERWALIFTGTTTVRIVGESVGQLNNGATANFSITAPIEPINPQTGEPYFSINPLGWGSGWSIGNVVRRNTTTAGSPVWFARTTLQGPATVASDSATLAFRADIDTP